MEKQFLSKNLRWLFAALMVAVFTIGMAPAPAIRRDVVTTTSDLAVKVISRPQTARACQTFRATFSVTNRGPDPASHLYVTTWLPDQLGLVSLEGAPDSLAVGQTVKFSARIKVVAFVPGETRQAWVGVYAMSDPYPNISIDPNSENDWVSKPLKLTGKPVMLCP
jgi:uncharacterized repeat protein (TIGR01451 family)